MEETTFRFSVFVFPLFFLFLASTIHSGTQLLFLLLMLAYALSYVESRSQYVFQVARFLIGVLTIILAIVIPFIYTKFVDSNGFFAIVLEESGNATFTLSKAFYWAFFGIMIFMLRRKIMDLNQEQFSHNYVQIFIDLLANLFLKALYISIIVAIVLRLPGYATAAQIRLLNMIVCLLLIILAFKSRNTLFVLFFSCFVLIDQVRTVIEALLPTTK